MGTTKKPTSTSKKTTTETKTDKPNPLDFVMAEGTSYRDQLLDSRRQYLIIQDEARDAGQFTSVVKSQENIKAIDQELMKLDAMERAANEPVSGVESKKSTLRSIRINREAALADKSYTASVNLLKQEQELVLSIAADEVGTEQVLSDEELLIAMAEAIKALGDVNYVRLMNMIKR